MAFGALERASERRSGVGAAVRAPQCGAEVDEGARVLELCWGVCA